MTSPQEIREFADIRLEEAKLERICTIQTLRPN